MAFNHEIVCTVNENRPSCHVGGGKGGKAQEWRYRVTTSSEGVVPSETVVEASEGFEVVEAGEIGLFVALLVLVFRHCLPL